MLNLLVRKIYEPVYRSKCHKACLDGGTWNRSMEIVWWSLGAIYCSWFYSNIVYSNFI